MKRLVSVVVAVVLASSLAGCQLPLAPLVAREAAPVAHEAAPVEPSWQVVVGLDGSRSYAMLPAAKETVARAIGASPAGSKWRFYWLDERSYSDRSFIGRFPVPTLREVPTNPMDQRGRAEYAAQVAQRKVGLAKARQALLNARPNDTFGTDVYGFVARAGEHLADAPVGSRKILVMATDLGDTRDNAIDLHLDGISCYVVFQTGDDASLAERRRQTWTERLTKAGAGQVRFVDVHSNLGQVIAQG